MAQAHAHHLWTLELHCHSWFIFGRKRNSKRIRSAKCMNEKWDVGNCSQTKETSKPTTTSQDLLLQLWWTLLCSGHLVCTLSGKSKKGKVVWTGPWPCFWDPGALTGKILADSILTGVVLTMPTRLQSELVIKKEQHSNSWRTTPNLNTAVRK